MKILCLFLPLVLLVAGCAHNRGGVVAGLATASALVVGIPFAPAAETLHAINQTGKKQKEKREYLASVFEPIYSERTALIEERSPIVDAEKAISLGVEPYLTTSVAFEKSKFGIKPIYPGLSQRQMEAVNYLANIKMIKSEEFTRRLWQLLKLDPLHEENEGAKHYYSGSKIYNSFLHERYFYMKEFNHRIRK